jgi:hypothetical protein
MPDRPPKESQALPDASSEVAELRARIEDLLRQLGRLEGRLELSERTESTLREPCGKGRHKFCPLGVYLA